MIAEQLEQRSRQVVEIAAIATESTEEMQEVCANQPMNYEAYKCTLNELCRGLLLHV
jgi:hypothetical protein